MSFGRLRRVTMLPVDKFRTTLCCSYCHSFAPPSKTHKSRAQHCTGCGKCWNRDTNAGRNMITAGLAKHYGELGYELPLHMHRGVSFLILFKS